MAQQNSFDIVSQVDSAEIANALNQTIKEVRQRFDFKGSKANVVHEKNELVLTAEDETKLRNMNDIQEGIPTEKAKEVVKFIKDSKAKVQASIQGDIVRVSGRDRDTLQEVIAKLKDKDFGIHMQFTNYRSN